MCASTMQVWLQEFCWSYRSKDAKLAARSQSAPDNEELAAAPMFCFEVSLNLVLTSSRSESKQSLNHFLGGTKMKACLICCF